MRINGRYCRLLFLLFVLLLCYQFDLAYTQQHNNNIPDPECNGPFGLCTQRDKDTLGYRAIKKIHENIDDDRDGHMELQETKEYMKEELQYQHGFERQEHLHGHDSLITVDELWKTWKSSEVHNWTTDDVAYWLIEHVKLPQYIEYFKRNQIDGQFMPRLAVNENNYYVTVLQIKDARHRNRIMLKATDLILFGQPTRANNFVKDICMISALTVSLIGCLYAFSKHRQSQEQIKKMMNDFRNIDDDEEDIVDTFKKSSDSSKVKQQNSDNNQLMTELNAAKVEAENLKKARENADEQIIRLKLAEKELDTVRTALQQTEQRINLIKYQPPVTLLQLLNRTYESEKELFEFKFKLIDKERQNCLDTLNKISKRQAGILGALKIAHSNALEEINSKLELLKCQIQKCKSEKQEWNRRWSNIDEIIGRNVDSSSFSIAAYDNTSDPELLPTANSQQTYEFPNINKIETTSLIASNSNNDLLLQAQVPVQTPSVNYNRIRHSPTCPVPLINHNNELQSVKQSNGGFNNDANKMTCTFDLNEEDTATTNEQQTPVNSQILQSASLENELDETDEFKLNGDYNNTNDDHHSMTARSDMFNESASKTMSLKRNSKTLGSHLYQFKKIIPFIKLSKKPSKTQK